MHDYLTAGRTTGSRHPARRAADASPDRSRRRAPARILIVDDEPDLRELVADQLRALGYRTVVAASGARALTVLRTDRDIDVVFTDLVMPGPVDGLRLAEEGRRLRPELKFVFTSGYVGHAAMKRRRPDAGEIFLAKPYRHATLAAAIARALSS